MKTKIAISVVITIAAFAVFQSTRSQIQDSLDGRQQESAKVRMAVPGLQIPTTRQSGSENSPHSKDRLQDVKRITEFEGFTSPLWSPSNSRELVFVGLDGTYLRSLSSDSLKRISNERARFKFIWPKGGDHLVFRESTDEQQMAIKSIAIHTGEIKVLAQSSDLSLPQEVGPRIVRYLDSNTHKRVGLAELKGYETSEAPFVYQFQDNIFVSSINGTEQITKDPGIYFLPQLSPDGTKVLYQEISRGLYIADLLAGTTSYLGKGDDAAWSPDGHFIVFEVTSDENDKVIGSDLYLADLQGRRTQLTDTRDRFEMRPCLSADGRYLAFDADGAVYVALLVEGGE